MVVGYLFHEMVTSVYIYLLIPLHYMIDTMDTNRTLDIVFKGQLFVVTMFQEKQMIVLLEFGSDFCLAGFHTGL